MTVRLPGRRSAESSTDAAETVASRLRALDRVVELGEGRLDDALLASARELSQRAGERLRLSGTHTVVALAGATGSGKSSLFNALAGTHVSQPGVRRPTTGVAHAVVWDADGAGPLLDWLEIPRRHATGWRSTASSPSSTCWCGCSTRRSTPTRRSTTATCGRSHGTAT